MLPGRADTHSGVAQIFTGPVAAWFNALATKEASERSSLSEDGLTGSIACPYRGTFPACYLGDNHSKASSTASHPCSALVESAIYFFLLFVSKWFEVKIRWLRFPSGTDHCCDELSINATRFSIELTRQLISISVCLTSSRISLAVISLEASWVLCVTERVCVCVCLHTPVWFLWEELSALSPTAVADLSVRP